MQKKPLRVVNGIDCYTEAQQDNHPDYHARGLKNLYTAERKHFWFISRRIYIQNYFAKYLVSGSYVLEIGAGTGYVAKGLQKSGYKVAVGEIHLSGLLYAKKNGLSECYQFDLFDPPFHEKFDAIGMFDVLEHLEKDVDALIQVTKMLKPGGKIFISVPAHQWLWNRDDSVAAHKRRYSKKTLIHAVKKAGLQVVQINFFFIAILPLLYIRHLLHKDSDKKVSSKEIQTKIKFNPIINKMLLGLTLLEHRIAKWLPNIAGGSLMLVAEKNPAPKRP